MVEDEEGEATMARKMPSSSACKAFNQEDEEDEFDRLACESLQRLRCRPKPALKTQVCTNKYLTACTAQGCCSLAMLCCASPAVLSTHTMRLRTVSTGMFTCRSLNATYMTA